MLDQLFEKINSELLTDEIKLEMTAMFESNVNIAIEKKEQELDESNRKEIAEFKDELTIKLDEYLTYFVEEFTQENEQQVEDAVKIQTAEKVLGVFEGIVNDFNMKLSDEVESNETELAEAKSTIDSQTEELLEARKQIESMQIEGIIAEMAEGFETETDQEKFREVAKTITFTEEVEYKEKLKVLSETISKSENNSQRLDEEDENLDEGHDEEKPSRMSSYLTQLS